MVWLFQAGEAFVEVAVKVPMPSWNESPVVGEGELCLVTYVGYCADVRREVVAVLVVEIRTPWRWGVD